MQNLLVDNGKFPWGSPGFLHWGGVNLVSHLQDYAGTVNSCSPGFYAFNSSSKECVQCRVCGPGEGIAAPCGGFNDTRCITCPEGQFSSLTIGGRECTECESCVPERTMSSPCTATQNSICGRCSQGYFLYVDSQGSECRRCSRCPTDRAVVHWIDCAEAGEPVDNQCAPGE